MPPYPDDEPERRGQVDRRLVARLLRLARPHRAQLALSILLLVATTLAELSFPALMKIGIDRYISSRDVPGLFRIATAYLALLLLVFGLRFFQATATQGLGQKIMFDLRERLYRHVQRLSASYFDRNPVGRIMTRLTGDVEVLNELFTSGLVSIFGDILILTGIVTIMLLYDYRLALVCFAILPPLVVATALFRARVREAYTTIRLQVAAMNTFLQERLTGMAIIQLFRREEADARRFDDLNAGHRDAFLRSVHAYAVYFPVVEVLEVAAVALILVFGGERIAAGTFTLGSLVAFIQYSERFFRPIRDLSERYNILQGAMVSSERIFELLDTPPAILPSGRALPPPGPGGEIRYDAVRFEYNPGEPILQDLSFRIAPGESVALVGHTGAGKTTIASLLIRLYDVQSGSVRIGGLDVRQWPLERLRREIALVSQDVFLFSGSALRNIGLRGGRGEEQVERAIDAVGIREMLQRLPDGMETELRERGSLLSVGQRQLLAFARALAHDPRILVLDEATSSVDTQTELRIREALRVLVSGRTSLIIAHRLSTIRYVDRILVLHRGRLVEEGTHAQLLARGGLYTKLYQLEFAAQEEALPADS